jgi:DNA repair protein RecN (Recombination protein N)
MLTYLHIRDFAIIDAIELELRPGMTVLTGETGAGKSILVDALQLLAGARAGAEVVRHGAERAEITGTFDLNKTPRELKRWLEDQSIVADTELSIRRVISSDGRSRAYLNGQAVAVQVLREAGNILIDIHGQHEFQSLTRSAAQRELLDGYGRLEPATGQVGIAHRVWLELLNRTLDLETRSRDRDAKLDLLRHQVAELHALQLKAGEVESLLEERTRLANRGKLAEGTATALQLLYENEDGGAHAGVSRAFQALRGLASVDPKLGAIVPMVEEAAIQIREATRELGHYRDGLDLDTARQDQVERRLAAIEELARKNRIAPPELAQRTSQLATELEALERADVDLAVLRKELASALENYRTLATQLSAKRATAGRALSKDITTRMQTLGMSGGRFQVEVAQDGSADPTQHGVDQIDFKVTANPGQPPRPLAKVASGGELSRLSLAVQVSCAARETRCMVFDEVDSGIGGAVAEIVGRELRSLGERGQVLCVTHLPQVASQGHHHLRVTKLTDGRTTRTALAELTDQDRVEELARMLGGVEVTSKAREHAREMLKASSGEATASGAASDSSVPGEGRSTKGAPEDTATTAKLRTLSIKGDEAAPVPGNKTAKPGAKAAQSGPEAAPSSPGPGAGTKAALPSPSEAGAGAGAPLTAVAPGHEGATSSEAAPVGGPAAAAPAPIVAPPSPAAPAPPTVRPADPAFAAPTPKAAPTGPTAAASPKATATAPATGAPTPKAAATAPATAARGAKAEAADPKNASPVSKIPATSSDDEPARSAAKRR